jgi:hypothetical protein
VTCIHDSKGQVDEGNLKPERGNWLIVPNLKKKKNEEEE